MSKLNHGTLVPGTSARVESLRRVAVIPTASGCMRSMIESQEFKEFLSANDIRPTDNLDEADLAVLFTCGVAGWEEDRCLEELRGLRAGHPNLPIVVTGCLPHANPGFLSGFPDIRIIGIREMECFNELLALSDPTPLASPSHQLDSSSYSTAGLHRKFVSLLIPGLERLFRSTSAVWPQPLYNFLAFATHGIDTYFVLVSEGCTGECAYCSVRRVRGRHRSHPMEQVLAEVREGLEKGYRKIFLLCDDLGPYGADIGTDAAGLLNAIVELPYEFKVLVSYFGPDHFLELFDALRPAFASGKIGSLMIPLQSGSQRILSRMNRHYDVDRVLEKLLLLRQEYPTILLKTCLIVGYPGEEEEDFRRSMKAVKVFDIGVGLPFSPRPGTPSETLQPRVRQAVIRRRMWKVMFWQGLRFLRMIASSLFIPKRPEAPFASPFRQGRRPGRE